MLHVLSVLQLGSGYAPDHCHHAEELTKSATNVEIQEKCIRGGRHLTQLINVAFILMKLQVGKKQFLRDL